MIKTCKNSACNNQFDARGKAKYCSRECAKLYAHGERPSLIKTPMNFIGVDGEGQTGPCMECDCNDYTPANPEDAESRCTCGHGKEADPDGGHKHIYVLLGVGQEQIECSTGLHWEECFEFLYKQFESFDSTTTTFIGFFLDYDFNQMFKTMPKHKVWQLLSPKGVSRRRRKSAKAHQPWPVHIKGWDRTWDFDLLAGKRLRIRPWICDCPNDYHTAGAGCKNAPWMFINDIGGMFKSSFMKVIKPYGDPNPCCTTEEYDKIAAGKSRRSHAKLDDEMRYYNRLENAILARRMEQLDKAYRDPRIGIVLSRDKWFGPGPAIKTWMDNHGIITRKQLLEFTLDAVIDAALASYYGGWFEIMAHGHIPGSVWGYDINSAYSYIISNLPCLKHKNMWTRNNLHRLTKLKPGEYALVYCSAEGSDPYMGPLPWRSIDGHTIARPYGTKGWYWQHEIEAAQRAGLIDKLTVDYRWIYHPCKCANPTKAIEELYHLRLDPANKGLANLPQEAITEEVEKEISDNKNSAFGKGCKVVFSSAYGKFAQSIGNPPFNNYIYASLITSGTRVKILDAIATHPLKSKGVIMVATDGVYFLERHPSLPLHKTKLGLWDETEYNNLTLLMPGFYWDDKARKDRDSIQFKARGVSTKAVRRSIDAFDELFRTWGGPPAQWPSITFRSTFAMTSCRQALAQFKWDEACKVSVAKRSLSSNPGEKRCDIYRDDEYSIWRSRPRDAFTDIYGEIMDSNPYDPAFSRVAEEEAWEVNPEDCGITPDGRVLDLFYDSVLDR